MEVAKDQNYSFLSFPPKYSIGEFVGTLKGISAHELWKDEYFALTVGDKLTSDMIEWNIRHHRDEQQSSADWIL